MKLLPIHSHLFTFFLAVPFFLNVFQNGVLLVRPRPVAPLTVLFVNIRDLCGVVDELNVADHVPRLNHAIRHHLHVESILHPKSIHQLEQLQHQVVLSQIVAILEHHRNLVRAFALVKRDADIGKVVVAEDNQVGSSRF